MSQAFFMIILNIWVEIQALRQEFLSSSILARYFFIFSFSGHLSFTADFYIAIRDIQDTFFVGFIKIWQLSLFCKDLNKYHLSLLISFQS